MFDLLFPNLLNILAASMLAVLLYFITQKGFKVCVLLFAAHSFLLALFIAVTAFFTAESHLYFGLALTVILKVIIIPSAFLWLVRKIKLEREVQFYINTTSSLFISAMLTAFSFYLVDKVVSAEDVISVPAVAFALSMMFIGFFIMISRAKALSQIFGFLIMENSLFLLATSITPGISFFMEIGISLDVLVALLIMGIFLFKINETFSHTDVVKLKENIE